MRIHVADDVDQVLSIVARWADRLRATGRISRIAFDTYYPETGRYLAIDEAEAVFVADSRFVLALLTYQSDNEPSRLAVAALSLFDMTTAFLGDRGRAASWLMSQDLKAIPERTDVEQVTRLVRGSLWDDIPSWPKPASARQERAEAIGRYRRALPEGTNVDVVLHSLLHMHHNRVLGVNRDREAVCMRLARQAAATWRASHGRPA